MPNYEYQCSRCHFRFELRQSFYEDPIADCPKCQSQAHRLFHPAGIIFKGSGWYATENHRGGSPKDTGAENSDGYKDVGD